MKTYVVDTHALVWYLEGSPRLGAEAERVLDDANVRIIIPAIVLAEVKYLAHRKRISVTLDEVLRTINQDERCTIYPADLSVVSKAPLELDIHDSLIVGTALVQRESVDGVITHDRAIATSGLIPTVW